MTASFQNVGYRPSDTFDRSEVRFDLSFRLVDVSIRADGPQHLC